MSEKKSKCVVGCVIGTRPEAIKMAPVIFLLQQSAWAEVVLINSAQHRDLLDEMLHLFNLKSDLDLNSMIADQSLGHLTGELCLKLDDYLKNNANIDVLLAAGDTTTVFVASLLAFYHQIPFGHIEAGLRTFNHNSPFPEEINRVLTAPLATWHFTPTETEKNNLLNENIASDKIFVTGNTVIDAMYWVLEQKKEPDDFKDLDNIIVVTTHRRESFGEQLHHICEALVELTQRFEHINIVLPVHPNPHVQSEIHQRLDAKKRIHLINPLSYDAFIHLMNRSLFIMTDSGGIQEEAPALRKPVIIMRELTERTAIVEEELGILTGTDTTAIVDAASKLLTDQALYKTMSRGISPYGDGKASEKIVACIKAYAL